MTAKLIGLAAGLAFGFVIAWAGVTDPTVIRNMLLLRDAHVFLLMGSAIVTAAIGVRVLRLLNLRSFLTRDVIGWTPMPLERRHVIGSAMFGLGWSVACTCPGPVLAMIGQGRLAGLVVGAGLLAGIAVKERLGARSAERASGDAPQPAGL